MHQDKGQVLMVFRYARDKLDRVPHYSVYSPASHYIKWYSSWCTFMRRRPLIDQVQTSVTTDPVWFPFAVAVVAAAE